MHTLLVQLIACAEEEGDTLAFLRSLRKTLVLADRDLVVLPAELTPPEVVLLFVTKKLVDDVWFNLCVDASFDFPEDDPAISSVSSNLRLFLLQVRDAEQIDHGAFVHFTGAVASYYEFVSAMNKQLVGHRLSE